MFNRVRPGLNIIMLRTEAINAKDMETAIYISMTIYLSVNISMTIYLSITIYLILFRTETKNAKEIKLALLTIYLSFYFC